LPNLYLKKKTDLIGFFKIKPRHPDGLKKTQIWVEKSSNGSPGHHQLEVNAWRFVAMLLLRNKV